MARRKKQKLDFFGNPIVYYPRSMLVRTSRNRYYVNHPGTMLDINMVPPGFTVMGDGSLRRNPRKRRTKHSRTR